MSGKYSIDDILNEVKRKKEANEILPIKPPSENKEEIYKKVLADAEAEAKAKMEAEAKARAEAELKKIAEAEAKAKAEAEAKAKEEAEAKARAEAELKKIAEAEAKARAEAELKKIAEAEAKAKMQAEAKAKEEAEAKAKMEAETQKDDGELSIILGSEGEFTIEKDKTTVLPIEEKENDGKKDLSHGNLLSEKDLLGLKTEEFSALGGQADKAEAWETFVRLTELREEKEAEVHQFKEEIDDYQHKEDERSIRYDLKSLRTRVRLRFWICLIFGGILTVLTITNSYISNLLPANFLYLSILILTVIPALFSITTVFGGLTSLFKFKPDGDTPAALSVIAALIFNIVLLFNTEKAMGDGFYLYNAVAVFSLAFCSLGKLYVLRRSLANFKFLTADGDKKAMLPLETPMLATKITRPFDTDKEPLVICSKKTGFLKDFLKYSFSLDPLDRSVKITAVISFLGSLLSFGLAFYFIGDIFWALNIFVLMNVLASPFSQFLGTNIPLFRAAKKALKHGGMITGYATVEDLSSIDALLVDSDELFPAGTIKLKGIKTFEGQRIDEAILDAASVIVAAGTTLKSVFSDIIDDKKELLKPVDTLVYEDSMGVSGWVDSKRVLIGNRTLMENHNIIVPSLDYENKYVDEDSDAIYLANSGTLTAMFVVYYGKDKETAKALYDLERHGVKLLVRTTDPNITEQKLSEIFSIDKELFSIVPSALHKDCKNEVSPEVSAPAAAAHTGRFPAAAACISAVMSAKKAISVSGFFVGAGHILSYILVLLLAVLGPTAAAITPTVVLLYHISLLLFSSILPSIRNY